MIDLSNSSAWSKTDVQSEMRKLEMMYHPYNIGELMQKTSRAIKFSLFETTQEAAYNIGRMLLIGDSSHPMVPYAGQGTIYYYSIISYAGDFFFIFHFKIFI